MDPAAWQADAVRVLEVCSYIVRHGLWKRFDYDLRLANGTDLEVPKPPTMAREYLPAMPPPAAVLLY